MKKIFYLNPDDKKWTMEDLGLYWNTDHELASMKNKINGVYFAKNGKIISEPELNCRCLKCLDPLDYNEKFDSTYCEACNEWKELACTDPDCEYCLERPEHPSDCY